MAKQAFPQDGTGSELINAVTVLSYCNKKFEKAKLPPAWRQWVLDTLGYKYGLPANLESDDDTEN